MKNYYLILPLVCTGPIAAREVGGDPIDSTVGVYTASQEYASGGTSSSDSSGESPTTATGSSTDSAGC